MCPAKTAECVNKCSNKEHGDLITSAIVRGNDDEAIAFIRNLCCQAAKLRDNVGRTGLHVAASCGKNKVIQWLLAHGADINAQDTESGYTALHRAIFYGNISSAILLCQHGANLDIRDKSGFSSLDLIASEQPLREEDLFKGSDSLQLYVWGTNTNYNLGQRSLQSSDTPEHVELIHREGDFIRTLSLNKFHTIFVSDNGRAFSCGFGIGGRLGLGNETSIIIPQTIGLKGSVKMAAAGVDHSIFLTHANQVYTCGDNHYHQLGFSPPPEKVLKPEVVTLNRLPKNTNILGVGAAKFHSVIWTETLLFTFGLNAGQLGHIRNANERTIVMPRQVSSLKVQDNVSIKFVAVSDGAIVVYTSNGIIQALHQYQVRCIASKLKNIVKIGCIGGTLDHEAVSDGKLKEKGGLTLRVAALDTNGYLYIWTEETHKLSQCLMIPQKRIFIKDFCINHYGFCLITKDYQAFTGVLLAPEKLRKSYRSHFKSAYMDPLFQTMKLKKLPALHRAVSITCDPKGNNFAAFQFKPMLFMSFEPFIELSTIAQDFEMLLSKSSEIDPVCDVILSASGRTFTAHSFMLSHYSSHFAKELSIYSDSQKTDECQNGKKIELNNNLDVNIFKEILDYIYTGSCQLVQPGLCKFRLAKPETNSIGNNAYIENIKNSNQFDDSPKNNKKGRRRSGKFDSCQKNSTTIDDPIKTLQNVASNWQIRNLEKRLSNLKLSDGYIYQKTFKNSQQKLEERHFHLSRNSFTDLWDVAFLCQDGVTLNAHKCVLVARSVYFEAMLMSGWIETSHSFGIAMSFPSKVLKVILDYLYEDEARGLQNTKDIDFICDVLVVAHQLLVVRLQQICERQLSRFISFKNAFELIKFSQCYDASGLRSLVYEFICLNLPSFVEMGILSNLDAKTQEELSTFYKYVAFGFSLDKHLLKTIATKTKMSEDFESTQNPGLLNNPRMGLAGCQLNYRAVFSTMFLRCITPMLPDPSHEVLQQALDGDPSIITETHADWAPPSPKPSNSRQTSKTTPTVTRKRRPSRGDGARSRKSSTSSQNSYTSLSEADTTHEFDDSSEPFTFDDLKERKLSQHSEEAQWVLVGKSPREDKSCRKEVTSEEPQQSRAILEHSHESPKQTLKKKSPSKISFISIEDKSGEPVLDTGEADGLQQKESFPSLVEAASVNSVVKKSGRMPKFQSKPRKSSDGKPKAPTSPPLSWRNPVSNTNSAVSLADIIQTQVDAHLSSHDQKKASDDGSPKASSASCQRGWKIPVEKSVSTEPQDGNFSSHGFVASPGESADLSLSEIIKEEIKNSQRMKPKKSKPLSMIQLEDRAMEELLNFYGGPFNPEERISVSRAT